MDNTIKTVKIRAFSDDAKTGAAQGNLTEDQDKALELAKKTAQLEEEKKKSSEQLKIIEQLRESLRQEQARITEITKKPTGPDASELALKEAQLEEEKIRTLENLKMIVQLRESLRQEQAKTAEMVKMMTEQEARTKELAMAETNELARKNTQLEEEKKKSHEYIKAIEQLREGLKQEQAKTVELAMKVAEQETMTREAAALEAKVRELTETLGKVAAIATVGKAV